MSTIINATTTNGVVIQPDNSGSLVLQTNNGTTALTIDTSQNATLAGKLTTASSGIQFSDASIQTAAASPYVLKNRIINGDMRIDQRNAGASGTASAYTVDRWNYTGTQASKGTWQQNAGSVTPPAGFSNYLGFTSSSSYSVLTGDTFLFNQAIEGYNIADLDWGTANAKTVTLSFWVRSSLTGTFGGALSNDPARSYAFSYTISAANTWEQKSITIVGDQSGTWTKTNSLGVVVRFGLGSGATYSGTAGAWTAGNLVQPTGTVSVVGTNGATFYITGVQLEIGTSATPFERRLYGQELNSCMRYYEKLIGEGYSAFGAGYATSTTATRYCVTWQVKKRTNATVTFSAANTFYVQGFGVGGVPSAVSVVGGPSTSSFLMEATGTYTGGAGFTILDNATSGIIQISAEL